MASRPSTNSADPHRSSRATHGWPACPSKADGTSTVVMAADAIVASDALVAGKPLTCPAAPRHGQVQVAVHPHLGYRSTPGHQRPADLPPSGGSRPHRGSCRAWQDRRGDTARQSCKRRRTTPKRSHTRLREISRLARQRQPLGGRSRLGAWPLMGPTESVDRSRSVRLASCKSPATHPARKPSAGCSQPCSRSSAPW
jgi:hypothetical protein